MKKTTLFCLLLIVLTAACKKYEEGPLISFRSAENRLKNMRILKSYTVNGVDSIGYLKGDQKIQVNFYPDYGDTYNLFVLSGPLKNGDWLYVNWHWKLKNNNKVLQITEWAPSLYSLGIFGGDAVPRWEILKLTHKEVKMRTTVGLDTHEAVMVSLD